MKVTRKPELFIGLAGVALFSGMLLMQSDFTFATKDLLIGLLFGACTGASCIALWLCYKMLNHHH